MGERQPTQHKRPVDARRITRGHQRALSLRKSYELDRSDGYPKRSGAGRRSAIVAGGYDSAGQVDQPRRCVWGPGRPHQPSLHASAASVRRNPRRRPRHHATTPRSAPTPTTRTTRSRHGAGAVVRGGGQRRGLGATCSAPPPPSDTLPVLLPLPRVPQLPDGHLRMGATCAVLPSTRHQPLRCHVSPSHPPRESARKCEATSSQRAGGGREAHAQPEGRHRAGRGWPRLRRPTSPVTTSTCIV